MPWRLERRCGRCGGLASVDLCNHPRHPQHPLDYLVVVAEFQDTAREAVHALKYEGRHAIAAVMGPLMAGPIGDIEGGLVAAITLHGWRRRERGYDQAEMLAAAMARSTRRPYQRGLIKRTRYTTQQVSLDAQARRRNVEGAFKVRRSVSGQTIFLVDDVYTTGATCGKRHEPLKTLVPRGSWVWSLRARMNENVVPLSGRDGLALGCIPTAILIGSEADKAGYNIQSYYLAGAGAPHVRTHHLH